MKKTVKKIILFSSIASVVTCSSYHLTNTDQKKTVCNVQVRSYCETTNYSAKIVAHRGLSSLHVENTYDAVIAAFDHDFIGTVEIDIQLTKDNEIVLFHDERVNNLTNGSGKIKDLRFKDLKKLDYYSRYINEYTKIVASVDSKKRQELIDRGDINKIAKFDDILSIDTNKTLLVDIKFDDSNANKMIYELKKKIDSYVGNMNFIFQSDNPKYLKALKSFLPDYEYQIIIGKRGKYNDYSKEFDRVALKANIIDEKIVNDINAKNKKLSVWTIVDQNDYYDAKELVSEVDGVQYITDSPSCLNMWLNENISCEKSVSKCYTKTK